MSAGMSLGGVSWTGAIVVGLTAVAIELAVLAAALRGHARIRRLGRMLAAGEWSARLPPVPPMAVLAIGAALAPLLVLSRMVYEVQRARATIFESVTTPDLGPKMSAAAAGLLRELGAILGGTLGLVLPLVLGAIAAGVALSARGRRMELSRAIELAVSDREVALALVGRTSSRTPAFISVILGFVLFGLGPVIGGAVAGTWLKLKAIDEMMGAAPAAKVAIYAQTQVEAGRILESGHLVAMIGVVCAAIGSAILLWLTSAARAGGSILGRPDLTPPSSDGGVIGAATLMVAALGLVAVGWPMKRENETPWPNGSATNRLGVETVALEGPDALRLAPLVALTKTGLAFEREPLDVSGIEDRLRSYRANFPLLHPGEPAPREILLACSPEIASQRVFSVLETARRLGYDRARLVFETVRTSVRPAIGTVTLRNVTAAEFSIGNDGTPLAAAHSLRPADAVTCAQLAARVVELRRAGWPVNLVPGPSPN